MEEEKKEEQFSSPKQLFEHNQQKIIERKERYYDKIIESLHLSTWKLDLLVVVLIVIVILIFIFGSHK
ncbi:MAG: hypothetical protein IJM79_02195 [Erysipelotrichaceae bacterium]|nr:hypothetical protein [Erysipelotrichaceae bacterium]